MKRHELTDEQYALVGPLLPSRGKKTGRRAKDPRTMLNGMLWILQTGAPWRDLPERFGPWQTVYDDFSRWQKEGVFNRILAALQFRLDSAGRIDWELWCVDGSNIRATRASAGAAKKVQAAIRTNRPTTPWAAARVASAPRSTLSPTAGACH